MFHLLRQCRAQVDSTPQPSDVRCVVEVTKLDDSPPKESEYFVVGLVILVEAPMRHLPDCSSRMPGTLPRHTHSA